MHVTPLEIPGAWLFEPPSFADQRGLFVAPFQAAPFEQATGQQLPVAQVNQSVSARGVIRGIHFADVPPGQAKFVSCAQGAALDIVVDLRAGSPTFGQHQVVELDTQTYRGVYLAEGLGHAFLATVDNTVVSYLCSTPYNPQAEHGIHPMDPELDLPWPDWARDGAVLSAKDAAAPSLKEALDQGLLPDYEACQQRYAELRAS